MSLHYLGKHEHEPRKLCLFSQSCCLPFLENNTALACYIFDMHQPILIIFVDNKTVSLSTVCKYYLSPSHFCFRDTVYSTSEKTQFAVFVFSQVMQTLVRRDGITNHHLITYSVSNISAENN